MQDLNGRVTKQAYTTYRKAGACETGWSNRHYENTSESRLKKEHETHVRHGSWYHTMDQGSQHSLPSF